MIAKRGMNDVVFNINDFEDNKFLSRNSQERGAFKKCENHIARERGIELTFLSRQLLPCYYRAPAPARSVARSAAEETTSTVLLYHIVL